MTHNPLLKHHKAPDAGTTPDTSAAFPAAVTAAEVAPVSRPSLYPEPFATQMAKREKRQLGDQFGLTNFGVNLARIAPGGTSALRHFHTRQDEFIYILAGQPVLVTNRGETPLKPGMCAGFKAGNGDAHHLINRTAGEVVYLEVGDRSAGDDVIYPDDDLLLKEDSQGNPQFLHKDGSAY
ncbi:cupin [Chimaeribacter californicus]|uniref:Cupin n=1 Tax=Chimaeribacter californicus TaxID=2060067 RepID=A0A2N5E9R0_9GAMM|nr:cupin domain-containing protein [Chimaeribacter californicus]PLR38644.1 cupin [Chimaeribacter californicus]